MVFAQLVAIDRASNSAEVDLAVNTLLQAIGEYTQAERTYIFEMMEEERIFTNIYEWCSEGVTPQIDNLLSNAVKYTSDGGTVTLEMYEEMLPETNRIRLVSRVQDSGIGMSREYMDVMYAKFSRAVDTRVNQVRGSGLGLSVVKELTDLLGGQVHVESAPEGTYNAILMDMQMPVMDGVQATETIRHMTRRDAVTIPIIAMTANAFQQDVASCMNAGMNGHLAKPFDLAKLLPMLADACRRQVRTEK